jgi:hypothetical protein
MFLGMDRKALIALAACLPALSAASAGIPDDCSNKRWVSVQDVGDAYSQRSIKIIRLAKRGDVSGLASLVAPAARFTVWEGDAGIGRKTGTDGAIEFAQRIGATTYSYSTGFAGPISTDICGTQDVTVWLKQADGKRAYIADFKYSKGILIESVANLANISDGKIEH